MRWLGMAAVLATLVACRGGDDKASTGQTPPAQGAFEAVLARDAVLVISPESVVAVKKLPRAAAALPVRGR